MEIIRRSFVVYDIQLHLISIKFDKLIYFWVGDEDYKCHDLQCAFPLKSFKDAKCTGSTLIGDLDGISQEISKALTIRFGCGVFMSINIKENDYNILSKFQEELFRVVFDIYPEYSKNSVQNVE